MTKALQENPPKSVDVDVDVEVPDGPRLTGRVKYFNQVRGFGFITADSTDYFVHISNVQGMETLLSKEQVEFQPVFGHKGSQALDVTRIHPPTMIKGRGILTHYNSERGYGFISRADKGDVFAHCSDFMEIDEHDIRDGLDLEFESHSDLDGRARAYKIRAVGSKA